MTRSLECWNCGHTLDEIPLPMSRQAACPACFHELHCCRLCRHFRPGAPGECDEDRADPPSNKDNANFCDWFVPSPGSYDRSNDPIRDQARARLDALFGKPEAGSDAAEQTAPGSPAEVPGSPAEVPGSPAEVPGSPAEQARARLDALFGDTPGKSND